MIEFITNTEIYEKVLLKMISNANSFVWIGTADLKDLHVKKQRKFVPFLEIFADLVKRGVAVRLIHAKEPGPAFRNDFDRYPVLASGIERLLCPRVHFKCVIVDGITVYSGSANLTGAGMGARNENKRNFESGFISDDKQIVQAVMEQFDKVWMGAFCDNCYYKSDCGDKPEND
jgi:phosphatidylserine/phosphatidylglycerophosphate/cardiolipin synthase-like enzyme